MTFDKLQASIRMTKRQRDVAIVLFLVMLAANVALSVRAYTETNQVVLVPTNVSDGMVSRGAVDKRYIEALALDAVYGLYNASPESLDYGRQVIERLASVQQRSKLLRQYDEVAGDMRERNISTVFLTGEIRHNLPGLEVVVQGNLQTFVDTVLISTEERQIMLRFVTEAGSVRLAGIHRVEVE